MLIADRIRVIRDQRPSPGDNQYRSILMDQYLLLLENDENLPDIDTLEAWARNLGVPIASLFYASGKPPELRYLQGRLTCEDIVRRSAKP